MWKRRKAERETVAPEQNAQPAIPPSTTKQRPEVHIGPLTSLVGELFSAEETLIEGVVEGRVVVVGHSLTVGAKARIVGSVVAREVVLYGSIDGDVEVSGKIEIHKDGHLAGDVHCTRIRIDDGAHLEGAVDLVDPSREEERDLQIHQLGKLSQAVGASEEPEEEPAQPPITDWTEGEVSDVNAA